MTKTEKAKFRAVGLCWLKTPTASKTETAIKKIKNHGGRSVCLFVLSLHCVIHKAETGETLLQGDNPSKHLVDMMQKDEGQYHSFDCISNMCGFFLFVFSQSKKPVLKAGGVKTLKTTLHILSSMQKCFFYLTSWAMRYCEIVIWTDGHTHPPSWSCLGRRFPLPMAIVMIRYSKNGRTKKWNRMENESMNTSQTTLRD